MIFINILCLGFVWFKYEGMEVFRGKVIYLRLFLRRDLKFCDRDMSEFFFFWFCDIVLG